MQTQKCTQCGSRLNISRIERGSKFACFNCGAILLAGEEVLAVKRSLREGPVFRPKAAQKEEPVVQRARRPAAPAAESKSKAPLLIGIGLVVVVGVVVAVVSTGGGDGPAGRGGGGGGGGGAGAAGAETASQWWGRVGLDLAGASAVELRDLLATARSRGYEKQPGWPMIADELYAALLEKAPSNAAANRHFGNRSLVEYPGFRELWAKMNDHFKLLPKETRAFLTKHEDAVESGKTVWLEAEEYAAAGAVLDSFGAWVQKLAQDPSLELIEKGRMRARGELGKFDAAAVVARPFILFVAYRKPENEADLEGQRAARKKIGESHKTALAVMAQEFESRFREPLNLPAIEARVALYIWMFETRADYDALAGQKDMFGEGADVSGAFDVKSRWAYAGRHADKSISRYLGSDLAHTAVYQLQWYFSRDPQKTYMNYFEEWNGLWFTVGFASWLGGGVKHDPDTGKASFTGVDPRRKAHLKLMDSHALPWVTLSDLTQLESWQGFQRWIFDSWLPQLQADEDIDEETLDVMRQFGHGAFAVQVFYAQAWALAHFLNEYEGGKYREQYRDLLATALRGKRKPQKYITDRLNRWRNTYSAFADIMGLKSAADWVKLQEEYEKHLKQLAKS